MDSPIVRKPRYVRVTGGAGLTAANLADRGAGHWRSVPIFACLIRDYVGNNGGWWRRRYNARISTEAAVAGARPGNRRYDVSRSGFTATAGRRPRALLQEGPHGQVKWPGDWTGRSGVVSPNEEARACASR